MKNPRSDRDLADQIVKKLSEDTPENAAMEVQSLLQCARDAGGGAVRAEYLAKAQQAIARLDPHRNHDAIQKLQAEMLALQGRRGDTAIAHVTPGEIVIPKSLQTPELLRALADAAQANGMDPAALRIGNDENSINPSTGQPEFADGVLAPPQGPMENIEVTGRRPFSMDDVNNAARIIYGEAGNQTADVKQKVLQTMLSRVGTQGEKDTLNGVMFDTYAGRDGKTYHKFNAVGDPRFTQPIESMAPADKQSWEQSLQIARDGISDAINNGVSYGPRMFRDRPVTGSNPKDPHEMVFWEPNPQYKKPYPK